MMGRIRWIGERYRRRPYIILLLCGMTLLSGAIAFLYPRFFKFLIDYLTTAGGSQLEGIRQVIAGFLLLGLFRSLAQTLPGCRAVTNNLFEKDIRQTYFESLLKKNIFFFQHYIPGDIIVRLTEDLHEHPHKLPWFCGSGVFRFLESSTKVLVCLVGMLFIDRTLTLLVLLPLPIMGLLYFAFAKRLREGWALARERASSSSGIIETFISNIRMLKAFSVLEPAVGQFRDTMKERYGAEYELFALREWMNVIFYFTGVAGQLIVVGYGGYLVLAHPELLSLGSFYAFYLYLGMILYPLLDLPNFFVGGRQAFVILDRLEEMRLGFSEEEIDPARERELAPVGDLCDLRFEKVSYRYPGSDRDQVSNLTFNLKIGEVLGLEGTIGSGKSSVLQLALGLIRPTSGSVKINGRDLRELNRCDYWRQVGFAPENPALLHFSVRENIALGREGGEQRLPEVIAEVNLTREVEEMGEGVESIVSLRGTTLSGGQKQRLSLGRALFHRPRLLLLDDVTSALDSRNEETIMGRILGVPNRMVLLASHRGRTLERCHHRLHLREGRVVEENSLPPALANPPERI